MNEYSQKIYDLLIEKGKEIKKQWETKKENNGVPEITLKFSEIPAECWEKDNVLETIENIKLEKEDGTKFDSINIVTSVCVSNKLQLIKVSMSYVFWNTLQDDDNTK